MTSIDNQHLVAIRRQLHAQPELSGEEYNTARTIADHLKKFQPGQLLENIGGTGVLAVFDSGAPGPSILFRAELDALPIQEINEFEYRSQTPNISHKCGHDGHSTILLGLAEELSRNPLRRGKAILLFQPAEENGMGAKAVLGDERFINLEPDFVFAFHNLPGYPMNQLVLKNNSFTAAVNSAIIRLNGKTSHAAEPEFGINPALPIADILKETDALSNNQPARDDFAVFTPVHIHMGEVAYGISAGQGEVHLTVRAWTEEVMGKLEKQTEEIVRTVGKRHGIDTLTEWTHKFYANENHDDAMAEVRKAGNERNMSIVDREFPFKWGEDFGLFTQKYKGAMFGIGAGENTPALHNPDYDFPDEIIPAGVGLFDSITSNLLR